VKDYLEAWMLGWSLLTPAELATLSLMESLPENPLCIPVGMLNDPQYKTLVDGYKEFVKEFNTLPLDVWDRLKRDYIFGVLTDFASDLSPEEQLRFINVAMTLLNHSYPGAMQGICNEWAVTASDKLSNAILFKSKINYPNIEFDFYKVEFACTSETWERWHHPRTVTWSNHAIICITNLETGKTIYFDNGGLGTQLRESSPYFLTIGGQAYGGVFTEIPSWLGPKFSRPPRPDFQTEIKWLKENIDQAQRRVIIDYLIPLREAINKFFNRLW